MMTSTIQLISLFVSLIFGIIFYYLSVLNFKLVENLKKIIQNIITMIYVFDMTIIYILIMYNINKGHFHIYFLAMTFLGYFVGLLTKQFVISKLNVNILIKKLKVK